MPGSFTPRGELDLSRSLIITCIGKKRSGKSVMGLVFARSYPWDLVALDIAADDGPAGPDVHELHGDVGTLPRGWPESLRRHEDQPMILRYVGDPGSSTRREDLDAVVGLAMSHGKKTGHCGILIHEAGVLAEANRTPPHTRRMLMHNRHNHVTVIACMPRPITVDPLVIAQSDLVYVFELPNPADRRRVAEVIGWDPAEFDAAVHDLGNHEYLRYDANMERPAAGEPDLRLVHFDALPPDVVAQTKRWARGDQADEPAA